MKIRLSKDEVYEIKLPDEIGLIEFTAIVSKFEFLLKNFMKFNITEGFEEGEKDNIVLGKQQIKEIRKKDSMRWKFLRDNREIFVEMFKTYYTKSREEFNDFLKKNNLNFKRKEMSNSQMIRIKELHNLKPQEVGLIKFPNKFIQLSEVLISNQKPTEDILKLNKKDERGINKENE